jgi:hypothetical protein
MLKSLEMILHPRQAAANNRYAEWVNQEDTGRLETRNPPDCPDRDKLIADFEHEFTQHFYIPSTDHTGWTFTQWAADRGYPAHEIDHINSERETDPREERVMEVLREDEEADRWSWLGDRNLDAISPKAPEADQAQRQA